jgi:hypothetical protein
MCRPAVLLFALGACTTGMSDPSTVEQQNGACVELEGRTFTSLSELECGLTPDGVARCHWSVSFATRDSAASELAWSYSDVSEHGRAECRGSTVIATVNGRTVTGTFDAIAQRLTWAGELYQAQ